MIDQGWKFQIFTFIAHQHILSLVQISSISVCSIYFKMYTQIIKFQFTLNFLERIIMAYILNWLASYITLKDKQIKKNYKYLKTYCVLISCTNNNLKHKVKFISCKYSLF